ncbi:MAG TPA: TIM barrel protein [Puia sp.]|nr:TIM barrel protein [Puia sp.]
MSQSRRTFLRNTALAASAISLMPGDAWAGFYKKRMVGIQLYSVRDAMEKDPAGSLKKIADMGYVYVEHANYVGGKFYGYAPKDFKSLLDSLGLKMHSGHTSFGPGGWDEGKKDFTDSWKQTVEDAAIVGQRYVISPWLDQSWRQTYDQLLGILEIFNKNGELCKAHGMKFGYHNHDFEFSQVLNGQKVYDIIMQHTDPKLVAQQLDMGNLYNGGAVAAGIAMQYPGRFELMHVKDEIKATSGNEKYESTTLGDGIVGTREICDLGKKGHTKYYIIEQESYQGKDPFDCARTDLETMHKWGY